MDILTCKDSGILKIEFNRPEKKNAITSAMYQTMADVLRDGHGDPAVRVILFVGKPDIFSAGNDLEDFLHHSAKDSMENLPVMQFLLNLSEASKPVVAAVAGPAIGIGTTMLLHCDLIYAAESAKFSMPFAQLALCPEFASSLLLQQIVGYQHAAEKLFLGETFRLGRRWIWAWSTKSCLPTNSRRSHGGRLRSWPHCLHRPFASPRA